MRQPLAVAFAFLVLAPGVGAQPLQPSTPRPDFNTVEEKTTDLGNRTYMLEGEGGNVVAAIGDDGQPVFPAGEPYSLSERMMRSGLTAVSAGRPSPCASIQIA